MKKYTEHPLQVRLHQIQSEKLDEMIKDESYCQSKGIYSKSDVVRNTINNALKEWDYTRLGTQ
ncbi:hypothetical protein N8466_00620 [Gammaproteobacteria bacterium]|jgi:hypothetical protein|nr:hypothetical protein [Gammaproteobacteria bacterium]